MMETFNVRQVKHIDEPGSCFNVASSYAAGSYDDAPTPPNTCMHIVQVQIGQMQSGTVRLMQHSHSQPSCNDYNTRQTATQTYTAAQEWTNVHHGCTQRKTNHSTACPAPYTADSMSLSTLCAASGVPSPVPLQEAAGFSVYDT